MISTAICSNCNAETNGRFCSACGQDPLPAPLTVRGMLLAVFKEMVEIDGRFVTTLKTMIFKPGRITSDYLPPFRIYLVASVALYFTLGLLTSNVTIHIDLNDSPVVAAQNGMGESMGFFRLLDARLDAASSSPEFGKTVYRHLPEIGFVLLPLVAFLLKLLYVKNRKAIGEHLLTAVHIKTGVFFVFIIAAMGSGIATNIGAASNFTTRIAIAMGVLFLFYFLSFGRHACL